MGDLEIVEMLKGTDTILFLKTFFNDPLVLE